MTTATLDRDALLLAVRTNPADDLPRLAFADLLDDADQWQQAAFIRKWLSLPEDRLVDLPTGKRSYWSPSGGDRDAHELAVPSGCELATWRRGFVESISLPLAAFQEHAEALFRAHPLTAVTLTDRHPHSFVGHVGFWRGSEPVPPDTDALPAWLWDEARATGLGKSDGSLDWGWLRFPDEETAVRAISRGAVAFTRGNLGLPLLEESA